MPRCFPFSRVFPFRPPSAGGRMDASGTEDTPACSRAVRSIRHCNNDLPHFRIVAISIADAIAGASAEASVEAISRFHFLFVAAAFFRTCDLICGNALSTRLRGGLQDGAKIGFAPSAPMTLPKSAITCTGAMSRTATSSARGSGTGACPAGARNAAPSTGARSR